MFAETERFAWKNRQVHGMSLTVYSSLTHFSPVSYFYTPWSVWLVSYCIYNIVCWIFPGSKVLAFVFVKQKDYFRNSVNL